MNTERCELRLFSKSDKQHIKKLYMSEQVRKYLGQLERFGEEQSVFQLSRP